MIQVHCPEIHGVQNDSKLNNCSNRHQLTASLHLLLKVCDKITDNYKTVLPAALYNDKGYNFGPVTRHITDNDTNGNVLAMSKTDGDGNDEQQL